MRKLHPQNPRLALAVSVLGMVSASACKPRADGTTRINHPAVSGSIEANEIQWNDGTPFGLSAKIYRNVASLTEMNQDQVCFEVILSGFDDEAAADLARAGFILYIGDERYTPRVDQLVEPHTGVHRGKRTEFATIDTGRREAVCVEGVKNDRGEIVSCTRWQENAITETHAYDVPQDYTVVQGAGQACFDIKGKINPADLDYVLLEITNAKSERTSAFWGVRYQATTRLRWDFLGDVPEGTGGKWGGVGGTELVKAAMNDAPASPAKGAQPEEEPAEAGEEKQPETAVADIPKIGVQACDDYIALMVKCADKTPAAKDAMLKAAKQSAESFKTVAQQKGAKPQLEKSCKQAADAYKQTCK